MPFFNFHLKDSSAKSVSLAQKLSPELAYLSQWWGEMTFELNEKKTWQLGSLMMQISRDETEWQMHSHRPRFQHENQQDWSLLADDIVLPKPSRLERFMFTKTSDKITIQPRLADLPVVIRPIDPIFIPAGQSGTLFVSTPIWISGLISGHHQALFDMPVLRPSDTWFGVNTRIGEVCYATNVFGRTDLSLLTPRPFRAVTAIYFHNKSNEQIELARMSLPTPSLQLYFSKSNGRLWTSSIEVTKESKDGIFRSKINHTPPPEASDSIKIGSPRQHEFSSLFSMFDF